jgi:predicted acetyltransferase
VVCDGTTYLGTVIIRHHLTPALERGGGHLGYHIVPGHRRRGYATQMLAQALVVCQQLGLRQVLSPARSTTWAMPGDRGQRRGP